MQGLNAQEPHLKMTRLFCSHRKNVVYGFSGLCDFKWVVQTVQNDPLSLSSFICSVMFCVFFVNSGEARNMPAGIARRTLPPQGCKDFSVHSFPNISLTRLLISEVTSSPFLLCSICHMKIALNNCLTTHLVRSETNNSHKLQGLSGCCKIKFVKHFFQSSSFSFSHSPRFCSPQTILSPHACPKEAELASPGSLNTLCINAARYVLISQL